MPGFGTRDFREFADGRGSTILLQARVQLLKYQLRPFGSASSDSSKSAPRATTSGARCEWNKNRLHLVRFSPDALYIILNKSNVKFDFLFSKKIDNSLKIQYVEFPRKQTTDDFFSYQIDFFHLRLTFFRVGKRKFLKLVT